MAYPAGFSSDEDEYGGFLSDGSGGEYEPKSINKNEKPSLEMTLNTLFYAITSQNLSQVVSILDEGIDIDVKLHDGWIPIMLAGSVGAADIVKELINRGADVNADKDKYTVLMAACSCPETTATPSDCLDIVTTLIEKGAKVDVVDNHRKTALMCAASNGCVEIVKKLITVCNIELKDNQGWNALFWAVTSSKPAVVEILLEAGLKVDDQEDVRRNTLSYYATSKSNDEMIKLLRLNTTEESGPEKLYYCDLMFTNVLGTADLQFLIDVYNILYAVKCQHHYNKFEEMKLVDFLCVNSKQLKKIGVIMPHEQNRILMSLFKFHQHAYKQKSIPVIRKEAIYSTMDLRDGLFSTIRQVVIMESSIKYLLINFMNESEEKCCDHVDVLRNSIKKIKHTIDKLNKVTQEWDYQSRPVDLIAGKRSKPMSMWWKLAIIVTVISTSSLVLKQFR